MKLQIVHGGPPSSGIGAPAHGAPPAPPGPRGPRSWRVSGTAGTKKARARAREAGPPRGAEQSDRVPDSRRWRQRTTKLSSAIADQNRISIAGRDAAAGPSRASTSSGPALLLHHDPESVGVDEDGMGKASTEVFAFRVRRAHRDFTGGLSTRRWSSGRDGISLGISRL